MTDTEADVMESVAALHDTIEDAVVTSGVDHLSHVESYRLNGQAYIGVIVEVPDNE